jgi:trans-aconitate 2-methyltransferase
MPDAWNPSQYERFKNERSQPFFDLMALVRPRAGMSIVDLGCGTGELTRELHLALKAKSTLGLDNSAAMLKESAKFAGDGLTFAQSEIAALSGGPFDLIFSNAALHWLDDHEALFSKLWKMLAPGGQLAVQVPANHDYPSHTLAEELAAREPYASMLQGYVRKSPVLAPAHYAALLFKLGASEQSVQLRVYGHVLESSEGVVEWVKGTLLTDYKKRLTPELYARFLADYSRELVAQLGNARPYFYPFKRILLWAARG